MNFANWEIETVLPVLIGAIALFVVILFLNNAIKGIFYQSVYLETLAGFAKAHGYKKPMSKWLFIVLETACILLGLLFLVSFLTNPFLTFGGLFVLVVIAVGVAVKFYTPPLKTVALRENLNYVTDVASGPYKGRDMVLKLEKQAADKEMMSFSDRDRMTRLSKRTISVYMALNNDEMSTITYENNKIITDFKKNSSPDFSHPEKMLGDIPDSDNAHLFITTINGNPYLTLKKVSLNFLSTAELYYLCEITGKILAAGNRQTA